MRSVTMSQSGVQPRFASPSRSSTVIEPRDSAAHSVRAHVPLATMFGYATSLRSRTQGRGTFVMEFAHYAAVSEKEMLNVLRDVA